jgi:hypothetical protein
VIEDAVIIEETEPAQVSLCEECSGDDACCFTCAKEGMIP